jgi:hypothetical protein
MFDFDVITGPTPPRQDERRSAAPQSTTDPNPPPQEGREQAGFSPSSLEGEGRGGA